MNKQEKQYLTRLSRAERAAFLKAHRKPPVPPSRIFDSKAAVRRKAERREAQRVLKQYGSA